MCKDTTQDPASTGWYHYGIHQMAKTVDGQPGWGQEGRKEASKPEKLKFSHVAF
jgi:hypothetical protein